MTRYLFIAIIALAHALPGPATQPTNAQDLPELGASPLFLGDTGVSVRIPVGSRAQSTRIGVQGQAQIAGPDGDWLLTVRTAVTRSQELEPVGLAAAALADLRRAHGYADGSGEERSLAEVVEPVAPRALAGLPGAGFVMQAPSATGGEDLVRGYAAAQISVGRFVVFECQALAPAADRALAALNAVAASLDVSAVASGEVSRAAAVRAGQLWLSDLDTADIDLALTAAGDDWFRLFRPAVDGQPEQELGYQRFQAARGTQDDLDDRRRPNGSKPTGVVVKLAARTLQPTDRGRMVIDARSAFWHSTDAEEEAWTVRLGMTETDARGRRVGDPQSWKTIGARTGDSMSVNIEDARRSVRSIRPQILGEGYLPRGLSLLLPRLYGIQGTPGAFGFYVYRSDAEAVVLRRDVVIPADDESGDVTVETLLGPNKPVQRTRVSSEGEIRWIELADGSRWEPIELDRLVALWKRKGLPLD